MTMNIFFENDKISLDSKTTAEVLAQSVRPHYDFVGVLINGIPCDFSQELQDGDEIKFLTFEDPEGCDIFRHSSAHVLAQAVLRLYPEAKPTIGPAIDQGFYYDFADLTINEEDLLTIEKIANDIIKENLHIKKNVFLNKEQAFSHFSNNDFKQQIIADLPEESSITLYSQGEFSDLCRGPHLKQTGQIKAFKILKTSGAYWRGNPKNPMLTRIYGISFPSKKELDDYLARIEEAKQRDHKILGPKLHLFSHQECAPGMIFLHPRGMVMWNALIGFWKKLHLKDGYVEILTPQLMSRELWEISGHWENYKQNMYTLEIDEKDYALKPMNCPGCMLYYKTQTRSYRDFPLKIAEIGHVHRQEASGALSGLMRVRSFHQDDAHLFIFQEQIETETLRILDLVNTLYGTFGLTYHLELSTKPDQDTIGDPEFWEQATISLEQALIACGEPFKISKGEGAFYGPKIDLHVKDALERTWQCGTIQLDMFLPERFQLEYTASDGSKKVPVMLHRALFGSIERFLGILIEHFKGKFPLWISPEQIRILTVADRHEPFAQDLYRKLLSAGFVASVDSSAESVGKKIRNAQNMQVNYMLTVGDKEMDQQFVTVRVRDTGDVKSMSFDAFLKAILEEKESLSLTPFL